MSAQQYEDTATKRDLQYELELLRKVSRASVNGVPVSNVALLDTYAFWQRFSQSLFSTSIRNFSVSRNFQTYLSHEHSSFLASVRSGILVLLGVCVSCIGTVFSVFLRPSILIFGIDRVSDVTHKADFRNEALYRFLKLRSISFTECLHTVFGKEFLLNLFIRKRLPFYLESLNSLYALFSLFTPQKSLRIGFSDSDVFTEDEKLFAQHEITKYMRSIGLAQFRVRALALLLRLIKPKAIWMIDDARHYQDISLAARLCGIPSYGFQHGHFTRYHVGWLVPAEGTPLTVIRPDYLVVWSHYWKKELLRLNAVFPESAILVGGFPSRNTPALPFERYSDLSILIPHETDSPKVEVTAIIRGLLDALPEAKVVMKLRPDHPVKEQLASYPGLPWGSPQLSFVTNISELTQRPSVVLGVYSTFLYDMILAGVPVGIVDTSMDYGIGMIENGLADPISPRGLAEAVRKLSDTPTEVLNIRRDVLNASQDFDSTLEGILRDSGIRTGKHVG